MINVCYVQLSSVSYKKELISYCLLVKESAEFVSRVHLVLFV
jgi:hypothetical protein